uniref:EGF-like domain-containing protein n=1 Tax=Oryzias melastigma TaxID=30732 RepID=A0A3B3CL92_ORYME
MRARVKLLLPLILLLSTGNFCSKSTVLRTQTACNSCHMSLFIACPSGYKRTPRSPITSCRYAIKTSSVVLAVPGCSLECYREVEVQSCCPGFWGPDCMGQYTDTTPISVFAFMILRNFDKRQNVITVLTPSMCLCS